MGEVLHYQFVVTFCLSAWAPKLTPSDSGCLFTCGDGSFGQLGHGDYQSHSSPVEVSFFRSKPVEQIACGMRHSLVLLKGNDTSLICFHASIVFWNWKMSFLLSFKKKSYFPKMHFHVFAYHL